MKVRLHGTEKECAAAIEQLRHTPGLHIHDTSRPYPDRTGQLVRVYLTVALDQDADAHRAPSAAGRQGASG
jgi:hypothetical protein